MYGFVGVGNYFKWVVEYRSACQEYEIRQITLRLSEDNLRTTSIPRNIRSFLQRWTRVLDSRSTDARKCPGDEAVGNNPLCLWILCYDCGADTSYGISFAYRCDFVGDLQIGHFSINLSSIRFQKIWFLWLATRWIIDVWCFSAQWGHCMSSSSDMWRIKPQKEPCTE